VETPETHGLGYGHVDDDPNVGVLLHNMDATGGWAATRELREWERRNLGLRQGQRLLDVGCGLGDAALVLAVDLGAEGELHGVDASEAMISAARSRAGSAACKVRFSIGNAMVLDEPADWFDAVRSERCLQWLSDPGAAIAEMHRVLRPGGRVSLIDADWSTFTLDIGDPILTARVREAMRTERARPSNIGGRLAEMAHAVGFDVLADTSATQTWNEWNPDESPAPDGCFSMASLADDLIERGQLPEMERIRFVERVHTSARNGTFAMTLTMVAVAAIKMDA